MQLASLGN